jgi:hypothetical protein
MGSPQMETGRQDRNGDYDTIVMMDVRVSAGAMQSQRWVGLGVQGGNFLVSWPKF